MLYSAKSAPLAVTMVRQAQLKNNVSSQVTLFHSSARRDILSPLPRECSVTLLLLPVCMLVEGYRLGLERELTIDF